MWSASARPCRFLIGLVAAASVVFADVSHAQNAVQQGRRQAAATQSVFDGDGVATVRLGASERDVQTLLGVPDDDQTTDSERVWRYLLRGGLTLEVHLVGGAVQAVGMSAPDGAPAPWAPKPLRGIRLGAPICQVVERYGPATDGRFWYSTQGIAFNVDGPADTVRSILVVPRGTIPRP